MTRKRAAAQRMRRAARQPGITPLLVPDIRFGARQCSERDLHWCSPTRRRTATRRRKLSGVPPAVATGQRCGPGPLLHIKTDSRLWLLCRARHKSHVRRGFYDLAKAKAPIAMETLQRIAALYEIEARVRGKSAADRLAVRQAESKPLVTALRIWFEAQLAKLPARGPTADAIRYALNHWDGLERFLEDGRIELGRVEVWRSCCRLNISVAAPFVWRCLTGSTLAPSPHPARQTGHADFPHPAFSRPVRPSLSAGRRVAVERCRGRASRRDTRLGSGGTQRLVVPCGASTSDGPVVPCMPERAHRFL